MQLDFHVSIDFIMDNYRLILPEHLNHYGFLFGGKLLMWVDEVAWMSARLKFPNFNFVTVAMNEVVFKEKVTEGNILRFCSKEINIGNTSIEFEIIVYHRDLKVFSNKVTLVRIDKKGEKKSLLEL